MSATNMAGVIDGLEVSQFSCRCPGVPSVSRVRENASQGVCRVDAVTDHGPGCVGGLPAGSSSEPICGRCSARSKLARYPS